MCVYYCVCVLLCVYSTPNVYDDTHNIYVICICVIIVYYCICVRMLLCVAWRWPSRSMQHQCQYLHFCTSKASKLSTAGMLHRSTCSRNCSERHSVEVSVC
jgi:hypothetical protein